MYDDTGQNVDQRISYIYSVERDEVEGYEDFGSLGRTKYIANHALLFLSGIKQPSGSNRLVISSAVGQ